MFDNAMFLNVLSDIGITVNDEIREGKFAKLIIKKETMVMKMTLSFPKVISVDTVVFLRKKFTDFFVGDDMYRKITIDFKYDDNTISDEMLQKYYDYIINIFELNKPRYNSLRPIHKSCIDGNVKFFVATEDEILTIQPLLNEINKIFKLYGLTSKCIGEISNFEVPVQSLIKEQIASIENKVQKEQDHYDHLGVADKTTNKTVKQPKMKNKLNGKVSPIRDIPATEVQLIEYTQKYDRAEFVILGDIIDSEIKVIKSTKSGTEKTYKIYSATINDGTDSIVMTTFINLNIPNLVQFYETQAVKGKKVRAYGYAEWDKYRKDIVFKVLEMVVEGDVEVEHGVDKSETKRVELHAHTKMSTLDGVMEVADYVKRASEYGFTSLAVTDHMNIHVWPDFENACHKYNIKPLYGVEGCLINEENYAIAFTDEDIDLNDATYCVYDIETTGLSSNFDEIIEIGACKIKNGVIIEEFSKFIKPTVKISEFTTKLTSITQDDVRNADPIEVVLPQFREFYKGCIMVAHNATFDNSHIYANLRRLNMYEGQYPTIDTLQLFRLKYGKDLKRFTLDAMVKFFDIILVQHHRAVYDAKATALCFLRMLADLTEDKITNYNMINERIINPEEAYKHSHPSHMTLYALNEVGKKNMYQIISDSHTVHFYNKEARILKSFLESHREGILVGSACVNGEVFEIAHKKSYEELLHVMKFYDFIEVQPLELYDVLSETDDLEKVRHEAKETVLRIIKAANELGKPVVATGDVHHLTKEDKIFREIYISAPQVGGGRHPLCGCKNIPSFHFRSTDEMLKDFSFLGEDKAYEIVVENSNMIADKFDTFDLFPKELFSPQDDFLADRGVPSIQQATIDMTYNTAKEMYGDPIPKFVQDRLDKELQSIIRNKFAPIYYIAYMLVKYSTDAGYVVGSRGSVGSSLVAHMMTITEVNGLPPHYFCPHCHFNAFKLSDAQKEIYPLDENQQKLDEVLQSVGTGFDLPIMKCPVCGHEMNQDGVDIPFETFLGFTGDKTPDIDLNFSGDFQAQAHEFCRTVFGVDRAFRAGTISTIAEKKAFGYVKGYYERKNIVARSTEVARLAKEIEGVKQSTGQHPGGIVVVPKEINYYDIVPIQYPADDTTAKWRITHFDYHKFESNLLKLDILGHDDPTMIRHLMDFVKEYPDEFPFSKVTDIPLNDRGVFKLFCGLESLGLNPSQTFGQTIGTTGLPEFGTQLTKDMLNDIRPTTVDELLKISGLSHGTDVWAGNAKDFMLGKKPGFPKIPFQELIGCRDDIMVYLMSKNLPPKDAFSIMEKVRKGKGVSKEFEQEMIKYNVPKWYIESCKLIKYMFPKAHATAYVIMALRIGWFKVYRPIFYYAGFFSRRCNAWDVEAMASGFEAIRSRLVELDDKIKKHISTVKEEDTYASLLLAIEMVSRGMSFKQMNIYESEARNFKVSDDRKSLLIPFGALDSLGLATANSIVEARNEHPFTSKKDILRRTKLNATQFERMNGLGAFEGLPEDDQLGLF